MWSLKMFGYQFVIFIFLYCSKDLNVFFSIRIADIEPKLIKLIRGSIPAVEPYIATFSFTEFTSICFCNQVDSKRKSFIICFAADQFGPCSYIPPLIGAAHLQFAVQILI